MAAKQKKAKAVAPASSRKPARSGWKWWQGMLGGMLLTVSPGGALLVVTLGAPALFVMVADTTPRHTLTRTVCLFSLAGIIQPLRTFLMEGHDIGTALVILGRPGSILFAWTCAGSGWLLDEIFCLVAILMTNVTLNARRKSLEATLLEIRTEWGLAEDGVSLP